MTDPLTDDAQPHSTPPGGGRWRWDAAAQAWVALADATDTAPDTAPE